MSKPIFRAVLIYLALVALLAAVGALNQTKYRTQLQLIDQKAALQLEAAALRTQAAAIAGPLAVQRWAAEQGMISASEVRDVHYVHPLPAPLPTLAHPNLEIQTIWR